MLAANQKYQKALQRSTSGLLGQLDFYSTKDIYGNLRRIDHLKKSAKWFELHARPLQSETKKAMSKSASMGYLTFTRDERPGPGSRRVYHENRDLMLVNAGREDLMR